MISTQRIIYCINPSCDRPVNLIEDRICTNCQTPLIHRYLWATGTLAANILPETQVADRYEVIQQQIWLDTQLGLPPEASQDLPKTVIPYLKLYQQHLHLPQVYGFVPALAADAEDILLLENVPIDETGNLYPTIADVWEQATAVRQVYWLWQILQLWQPLAELGVEQSLLIPDNLRVQGWCVRLLELHPAQTDEKLRLRNLGQSWQSWIALAQPQVAQSLQNIVEQMCDRAVNLETITTQLNTLLLSAAAELPLSLQAAGATDIGTEPTQNEDTCYPNTDEPYNPLMPRLSMVCDGIGGHQGGEVASQMAVQSLKLQIRALLAEVAEQSEPVAPKLLQEQLEASLRVVNNLISSRNDEQKRQGRERMATTLVMALQLPQKIATISGWQSDNAHELYLANIGDSRAYWITRNYCQLLTVDDDVAWREVRFARSFYRQALQRVDATALTQALGTKDAESLRLSIQRFIIDEEGLLLLCSDGLSDNHWVEHSWQDFAIPVLTGELSVEETVHNLINLANQKNGHDNTSVVLTLCRLAKEYLVPVTSLTPPEEIVETETPEVEEPALTESAQALLDLDLTEKPTAPPIPTSIKKLNRRKPLVMIGRLLALLVGGTTLGLLAWWQINPQTFQTMCRKLPQTVQSFCSQRK
ncbi:protein phosphatase 2C domain-containing protein [Fortiea sp. LEGE XX443]|uniref:protein phosphatase 2C domain-containing protein n=1 Tax=Fortiea sp. LEGE XX443 TaxID=1828611 RepID=UPI001882AE94|nr:protein phosphatase 2C domain-containing protein [Fortiea sp. LEGE XX443]MBE9004263.1 protein phosphatase 2C domain-containing protein [Fortiea sp. LEGE XX443]